MFEIAEILKIRDGKIWYRYKKDRFACYYSGLDTFINMINKKY